MSSVVGNPNTSQDGPVRRCKTLREPALPSTPPVPVNRNVGTSVAAIARLGVLTDRAFAEWAGVSTAAARNWRVSRGIPGARSAHLGQVFDGVDTAIRTAEDLEALLSEEWRNP